MNTSDRLKQIMRDRNLKQIDVVRLCAPFCKKYGERLDRNDMSQYVSGKILPGQRKLTILGLALNVSEPWLMGYDVPPEREQIQDEWMQSFCKSVDKQIAQCDRSDLVDSGTNYNRLEEIASGVKSISLSEACNIADELGCSLDVMVGKVTIQDEKTSEFIMLFSKLTPEQKKYIFSSMKGLIDNQ